MRLLSNRNVYSFTPQPDAFVGSCLHKSAKSDPAANCCRQADADVASPANTKSWRPNSLQHANSMPSESNIVNLNGLGKKKLTTTQ